MSRRERKMRAVPSGHCKMRPSQWREWTRYQTPWNHLQKRCVECGSKGLGLPPREVSQHRRHGATLPSVTWKVMDRPHHRRNCSSSLADCLDGKWFSSLVHLYADPGTASRGVALVCSS